MSHRFFDLYCKQLHTNLVNIYLSVKRFKSSKYFKKVYNFYNFKQVKQKPLVLSKKIGKIKSCQNKSKKPRHIIIKLGFDFPRRPKANQPSPITTHFSFRRQTTGDRKVTSFSFLVQIQRSRRAQQLTGLERV